MKADVCKKNLEHVRDFIRKVSGTRSKTFRFAFVCKSGRHRSVAQAYVTKIALGENDTVVHSKTTHREKDSWQSLCYTCKDCKDFKSEMREEVEDQIVALWNTVSSS